MGFFSSKYFALKEFAPNYFDGTASSGSGLIISPIGIPSALVFGVVLTNQSQLSPQLKNIPTGIYIWLQE